MYACLCAHLSQSREKEVFLATYAHFVMCPAPFCQMSRPFPKQHVRTELTNYSIMMTAFALAANIKSYYGADIWHIESKQFLRLPRQRCQTNKSIKQLARPCVTYPIYSGSNSARALNLFSLRGQLQILQFVDGDVRQNTSWTGHGRTLTDTPHSLTHSLTTI